MSGGQFTLSIEERQRRISEEFRQFDDWIERYQYLIEYGEGLPAIAASLRIPANHISECHGSTFLAGERREGLLFLYAASDIPILAGVLALLVNVYSGMPPRDILRHPAVMFEQIGLIRNLSPHRRASLIGINQRLVALASDISWPGRLAS
ncbi:SufE family protein (plasmid) [Nitrobacteraceae bacterium UC4446_H13]